MKKKPITSILLYIFSIVLLLLATIQLFQATSYVMESLSSGYVTWSSEWDTLISYISQACTNTYCFAVLFYVLGSIYVKLDKNKEEINTTNRVEGK